jgi:hypothetical protein
MAAVDRQCLLMQRQFETNLIEANFADVKLRLGHEFGMPRGVGAVL